MITIPALRRGATATVLFIALGASLHASTALAQQQTPTDEEILKAKCTLCHSGHRIYQLDPAQIRPVLERMRAMNPDWITTTESDHLATVIAKLLEDPAALATRTAWREAVERGQELFSDARLGTTGKSCSSCHTPGSLRNVEDAYPKFDPGRKRFVDLNEAINYMIQEKMKGTPLPPNDQRYFDLLSYIKTLK